MRFTAALALASALTATALPTISKRQNRGPDGADIDADILQYALTLEHLENAFYKKAISTWPQEEFLAAGFSQQFYDTLKYIAHDEEGHVLYLEAGLTAAGATPVAACEYAFPMTTPKEFVALASVIEGVGVSAYLGAAADITSKAYLTAAGSILVTEALHQSATRSASGEQPAANVFGTPLGLNAVYTIASGFITSCPSTNAVLPVKAYQALTLASGMPSAPGVGALVALETPTAPAGDFFVTFVSGLNITSAPVQSYDNGVIMAAVPEGIEGQSYIFLTSDNSGNVTDATVLAGPAIIEITSPSPTFDLTIQ